MVCNQCRSTSVCTSAASDQELHCLLINFYLFFYKSKQYRLIVLEFNNTSILMGHFVLSPREREKRDRRDNRDERETQGRKRVKEKKQKK